MPAPVIMVHGAFCGGWSFEAFKTPFEAAGHPCRTPDLPGHARGGRVSGLSVRDYARAVVQEIEDCDEPPILIGHSLGGLVAQLAAARGRVKGMVLLAPSPAWGEAAGSFQDAAIAFGVMSLTPWFQAVEPDRSLFSACGLDRLDKAQSAAVFANMTAESGRALAEVFNWWLDPLMATHVPPGATAPALVIHGEDDPIHGAAQSRAAAARLGAELHVAPGMSHWLIGEPGWEKVAKTCLSWIGQKRQAAA